MSARSDRERGPSRTDDLNLYSVVNISLARLQA